ncbi:MAG: serine protease [Spirochaetales bacterium]|nr:serine protease [Spirochaetales bacterium]
MEPGTSVSGMISLQPDTPWYQTFIIEVPADSFAVRLYLTGSQADLDIFIKWDEEILSYDDVDAFAAQDDFNEELFVSRMNKSPLKSGTYYVDVAYQLDTPPISDGEKIFDLPFTLNYEVISLPEGGGLTSGEKKVSILTPEEGMVKTFSFNVPSGTNSFRVDLFDTMGDLDFFIRYGEPARNEGEADYIREWVLSRESLVLKSRPGKPLKPGTYYITVFDQIVDDAPETFSIVATLDDDAPAFLRIIPFLTVPEEQMERALLSTMEIIAENGTGSGCIVSKAGLVLTNYHVIESAEGKPSEEIYGAVTLTPENPPVELFKLKVVDYNEDKDLALLQVDSGFYGQDLPYGYEFPFFELGNSDRLRIGQPLVVIGYPGIGGTGSRSSVSITQGIVSGYQRTFYGTIIKTDAEINGGNSGGAVINAFYELVGLPTMVVNEDAGQMGFIHPVSLLPLSWLRRIETQNRD